MAPKEKSFKDCTLAFLEKTFGLKQIQTLPALEEWIQMPADISDFERQQLIYLRKHLEFNVHDWNEHELDSKFIGPLFAFVDFSSTEFNHFSQRDLEGIKVWIRR